MHRNRNLHCCWKTNKRMKLIESLCIVVYASVSKSKSSCSDGAWNHLRGEYKQSCNKDRLQTFKTRLYALWRLVRFRLCLIWLHIKMIKSKVAVKSRWQCNYQDILKLSYAIPDEAAPSIWLTCNLRLTQKSFLELSLHLCCVYCIKLSALIIFVMLLDIFIL